MVTHSKEFKSSLPTCIHVHAHTKKHCPRYRRGNVLKLKISDQYPTIIVAYNWYLSSLNHIKHHSVLFPCAERIYTSSNVNAVNELIISKFFPLQKDTRIYLVTSEEILSTNVL